jgi:penicillin-insensitive murein endopeptidase
MWKKKLGFMRWMLLAALVFVGARSTSQIFYQNKGTSKSIGPVHNGKIQNSYLLPYSGKNYKFFSPFSYYILGRAYVHSTVYSTVLDGYKICESKCDGITFRVMECSSKKGGNMFPHRTHQNGKSLDFMTPLIKMGKQHKFFDRIGIFRYALNFDKDGELNLNKKVSIDYETMAQHILAMEEAARKNGMYIKKVIFKINLKDNLFATTSGKQLQRSGIYFAQSLPKSIDNLHDDHYHIDFGFL